MSHTSIVFSPPGTPLLDRTVGELVAERPGRSRIFQAFNIDFCCQGFRTLRKACQNRGVSADAVVDQLEAELANKPPTEHNPAELPPAELASYIVQTHHEFLRLELPRLRAMAERVAEVHGGHTPSLVEILHIYTSMQEELESHMIKEEQILFPIITAMSLGEPAPENLEGPIDCMIHEHEDAGAALAAMRKLSHGFAPPADACNTYRALFAGLREIEDDLHRHIHLENAVLFPVALQMAEQHLSK